MVARPRSASSSETSHPTVSRPARTHTCAMPAPMVPRPTTPTRLMSTRASLDLLDHGRDRLALADAYGGDPVALAAPVELGEQRGRDARPAGDPLHLALDLRGIAGGRVVGAAEANRGERDAIGADRPAALRARETGLPVGMSIAGR